MLTDVSRSYSKLLAFEASRILFRLGCDVRVYDPAGLPVKDDVQHSHPKVQELRDLSRWSDGQVWISPEQHGTLVSLPTSFTLRYIYIGNEHSNNSNPDSSLQKPNRLDPPLRRLRPPNTRPHPRRRRSLRRLPILQRRQLPAHPRPLDAHVRHPEPILRASSVHAIHV